MKNITYIIIFSLVLAIGLVYKKKINYENITDELLIENIEQSNKIKYLKSQNLTQNQTIKNLENNLSQERDNTKKLKELIVLLESKLPFIDSNDTNK